MSESTCSPKPTSKMLLAITGMLLVLASVLGGAAAVPSAVASPAVTELEQPREISLMIQVHSVKQTSGSLNQLRDRLEHIRTDHRNSARDGFVRNLVLTDIGGVMNGNPVLDTAVLDVLRPYLPGGELRAFDNVFVGTLSEPQCTDAYASQAICDADHPSWSPYVEGILGPQLTEAHLTASFDLARQFRARYPSTTAHWYISWEGFLPDLMRDVTYDAQGHVIRGSDEHASIRAAFLGYQTRLINGLQQIARRAVMWSPAVQQPLKQLDVDGQRDDVATNLRAYFSSLQTSSGTSNLWLAIQDTLGRCYLTANSVDSTIAWRAFIAGNHSFANLAINAETFATDPATASCGQAWTSRAVRERVRNRLLAYDDRGERLGASFDLDHWYEATHEMPSWPNP